MGFAHFRGPAHPLNQALGLVEPIDEAQLLRVEAFLGAPTVLELSPGADAALPRFRGRGLQKALVFARLHKALALGCHLACAGTAPGGASQRTYEGCGLRVAYPKLELARP